MRKKSSTSGARSPLPFHATLANLDSTLGRRSDNSGRCSGARTTPLAIHRVPRESKTRNAPGEETPFDNLLRTVATSVAIGHPITHRIRINHRASRVTYICLCTTFIDKDRLQCALRHRRDAHNIDMLPPGQRLNNGSYIHAMNKYGYTIS